MASIRLSVAFVFALGLTAVLFWLLWAMIHTDVEVANLIPTTRIEFTRMRHDTQTETKREEKVERQKPPPAPTIPRMSFNSGSLDSAPVQFTNPNLNINTQGMQISGGSDRDVIPLVRINPDYPQRALSRGIEGWVQVQFTITAAGTVKDAKVVDADPKNIFNEAALRAISRWRYNPKIENGQPVERVGLQTIIRFEIEK